MIFTPNPPPTSGVTTSTRSTGSESFAAMACRTLVEVCVEVCTSSDRSSESQRASTPLPSIGIEALRSMDSDREPCRGAAAMAASASPYSWTCVAATFPGTSSWTSASPSRAAATPTTTGSGS